MKDDIYSFVKGFHSKAILLKAITSSFITLTPNVSHPINLEDFMMIGLVGSLYKIVAKLLVSRLKNVLSGLISRCQSTLVNISCLPLQILGIKVEDHVFYFMVYLLDLIRGG